MQFDLVDLNFQARFCQFCLVPRVFQRTQNWGVMRQAFMLDSSINTADSQGA